MPTKTDDRPSVSLVSTPDAAGCGIGTYTGQLTRHLEGSVNLHQVYLQIDSVKPIHFLRTAIRAALADTDVVHVQHEYGLFGPKSVLSWVFFPILYVLTTLRGKPIVLTVHEAWSRETIESRPYFVKWWYIRVVNWMLRRIASDMIFLSDSVEQTFSETTDIESTHRIPHGVVFEEQSEMSKAEAKQLFGYDPTDTVIVEPGYVSRQKGHDVFVTLAKQLEDTKFLIAGGSRSERDQPFIDELRRSLPENVQITGILEDKRFMASFQAADAVVLPYRKDGQSGVLNWCASYEVPVATSKCGYFTSIAELYDCVELFPLTNVDSAADAISRVLTNDERRRKIITGLQSFKQSESFEVVAERHIDIYETLV